MFKNKNLSWLFSLFIFNLAIPAVEAQYIHEFSAEEQAKIRALTTSAKIEPNTNNSNPTTNIEEGNSNTDSIMNSIESGSNSTNQTSNAHQKISLTIRITVPHNKNASDWCRIYPYPVEPPKKKAEIDKLPTSYKTLRSLVLTMSYWQRTRTEKPFPAGGWRMQYVLENAATKSGLGMPHTIFTEYPWVDNIMPYVRKEIVKVNAKEEDRKKRYELAQSVFTENRADLEVEAFNQGLFPIDVPIRRDRGGYRSGHTSVDKTNWWIVVIHKVPGLKYYWLYPVKLSDLSDQLVTLTENNAIYIEGAW